MNTREILRQALTDPNLELEVLEPSVYGRLLPVIRDLPQDGCISEWRHTLGIARYEYHVHRDGIVTALRSLYNSGIRGGNPKLVRLYSKPELEALIQESSKV